MALHTYEELKERTPAWYENAVGEADAGVTLTRAAETGKRHFLLDMIISYDKASVARCRVFDGSTSGAVLYDFFAHNSDHFEWHTSPISSSVGNALTVKVFAGSAGALAAASMAGVTG